MFYFFISLFYFSFFPLFFSLSFLSFFISLSSSPTPPLPLSSFFTSPALFDSRFLLSAVLLVHCVSWRRVNNAKFTPGKARKMPNCPSCRHISVIQYFNLGGAGVNAPLQDWWI